MSLLYRILPRKGMREAKRTLKPGGLYILFDTGIGGVGA